jgi:hypothetical protein
VFFEQAHFGNVWKQHRAWTLEKNAFDYELFAQQYERIVRKLLARELTSMNGDGASMKVLPVSASSLEVLVRPILVRNMLKYCQRAIHSQHGDQ